MQYAALPYRQGADRFEILLVTSLGTKRWMIPKGWPMKGHAPHEAAVREALEEAGLEGQVARECIGWLALSLTATCSCSTADAARFVSLLPVPLPEWETSAVSLLGQQNSLLGRVGNLRRKCL